MLPLATVYLRIYFLGLPVMALYNFSAAALRALGNTRQPLIYLAIAGVLNVIMNLFFVIVVGIDVAGVAIATVLSQCVSGFLTVRCLLTSQELHVKELHFSGHIFKKMMNIGIPAGIQGSLFSISNFIIQASSTRSRGGHRRQQRVRERRGAALLPVGRRNAGRHHRREPERRRAGV